MCRYMIINFDQHVSYFLNLIDISKTFYIIDVISDTFMF